MLKEILHSEGKLPEEKSELQDLKKYNVIFLKDKKALFDLEGKVFVQDK